MTLYQQNFTFLPVPPRTLFSHGDEATRFRLPDCTSVAELQQHVTRLLIDHFTIPGFWPQVLLGASVVCVLVIVIALIIARRMYEQSFWLVRVMRRPTGIVIVPNTLLAFTLFEGIFAILYIAFCWMLRAWYQTNTHLPHRHSSWALLIWLPLFCGPFSAIHGTYFAMPTSLPADERCDEEGNAIHAAWFKRIATHSVVLNTLAIVIPLLVFVSIATPAAISDTHYERSLRGMQAWIALYEGQIAFTQDMVQDAQRVWFDLGRATYIAANVYAAWAAYAFSLGGAYMWVTMRLLRAVNAELRNSERDGQELNMVATQFVVSEGQSLSALSRQEDDEVLRAIELELWKLRNAHRLESRDNLAGGGLGSTVTNISAISALSSPKFAPSIGRARTSRHRFSTLRKLIPNIVAKAVTLPRTVAPSQVHQLRDLRKAYRHHLLQALAVAPGCVVFAIIAMWRSITVYSSTEQPRVGGGSMALDASGQHELAVSWALMVLGSITLIAIAKRTYEPVLTRKWTSNGARTGRKERGGHRQDEQVQTYPLPTASKAQAARLGAGLMSFDARTTQTISIRLIPDSDASTSGTSLPLRNKPSSATIQERPVIVMDA